MNKYLLTIPLFFVVVYFLVPKNKPITPPPVIINTDAVKAAEFLGEKGQSVKIENDQLIIDTADFETNKVKFFNTTLTDGKIIYFLVLKDKDGNFRAAANANQQCAAYGKGYRQVGEELECLTCNKKYPITDFAIAKPDCNPFPINSKLPIINDQIIISLSELAQIANLF